MNTKICEVDNKIPDTSSLLTTTVVTTKISKVGTKTSDHAKCIKK